MRPAAYAVMDLKALAHNLAKAREYAHNAKVMAVIKANAYGHGLVRVAEALQGVDAFAVARVEEALWLRNAGITQRIAVLEGFTCVEELEQLLVNGFEAVIHSHEQLDILEQCTIPGQLPVWLKLDTGMNRLGFQHTDFAKIYERLMACSTVVNPIAFMTHLANADDRLDDKTLKQIALFNETVSAYQGERSIANSAGVLAWKQSLADWVRPGILLYGVSPFADCDGQSLGLKPVMSLWSRLVAIKQIAEGETVGYGGQWVCEKPTLLGVAAVGYGDGYPRQAVSGTPVLVNNVRVPLIGKVSMDMITVDLQNCPDAVVGDPVTLWGESLPVEEVAGFAGTIPYTLLCSITQRVQIVEENETEDSSRSVSNQPATLL